MTLTHGMDSARAREVSTGLALGADRLERVGDDGAISLGHLSGAWSGVDSGDFVGAWTAARDQLARASESLRSMSGLLLQQADAQDAASGNGVAGDPGPRGGAGAPVGADEDQSGNPKISGDDENVEYEEIEGPVFADGVSPGDVSQGQLGDCWLIASMMSLARTNPELIERSIVDNGDGTYTVTLYDDGEPVEIVVDGEFPAVDGDPFYADNDKGPRELWPMILEKAAAQHMGGDYEDVVSDRPQTGLELLTGQDADVYDDDLWFGHNINHPSAEDLHQQFEDGATMVFSTHGDNKSIGEHQLVGGHAYVITDVAENGDVTLQNPWGVDHPPITVPYDDFEKYARRLTVLDVE